MSLKFWTNQSVAMSAAPGAATAITAIAKATGAACSSTVLPAVDTYVLLEVSGMRQVNKRVFKVLTSGGGVFTINADSTLFSTFTSGTWRPVVFSFSFNSLRDPSGGGGDPVFEDTTTIHDPEDTQDIVSSSPQTYSFTANWEPADAALIAANTAFISRSPRAFRIVDPDNSEYLMFATVAAALNPTVSGKKKVTPISLSLQATGSFL